MDSISALKVSCTVVSNFPKTKDPDLLHLVDDAHELERLDRADGVHVRLCDVSVYDKAMYPRLTQLATEYFRPRLFFPRG